MVPTLTRASLVPGWTLTLAGRCIESATVRASYWWTVGSSGLGGCRNRSGSVRLCRTCCWRVYSFTDENKNPLNFKRFVNCNTYEQAIPYSELLIYYTISFVIIYLSSNIKKGNKRSKQYNIHPLSSSRRHHDINLYLFINLCYSGRSPSLFLQRTKDLKQICEPNHIILICILT